MSLSAWRIATEAPSFAADDLSGKGAELSGGRWNRAGTPMLYCADSIALACLETLVHLRGGGLPLNRYLVRIEIPDALWDAAERVDAAALVGWDALPAGKTSLDHGEAWVRGMRSAVMLVPSIVVPEECNVLVNPRHPGVGGITASKVRRWVYDSRTA